MSRYPKLPENLKQLLHQIEPSRCLFMNYLPCVVRIWSGSVIDRVYVQNEIPYIKVWGVYPEQDRGKSSIQIGEVVSLEESPSRLPALFATQLYQEGETGMGGHEFKVTFSDGATESYTGGNAVDFIGYPAGKTGKDIVAVKSGRQKNARIRPSYFWCLYS